MQIPKPKLQIPKTDSKKSFIGIWILFGIWDLEIGAFPNEVRV
jgi:hypothetical protein